MTVVNKKNPITSRLIGEIKEALESVKFGSIEIFIQNKIVTQITVRNIHKTSVEIQDENLYDKESASKKIIIKNKTRQMSNLHE